MDFGNYFKSRVLRSSSVALFNKRLPNRLKIFKNCVVTECKFTNMPEKDPLGYPIEYKIEYGDDQIESVYSVVNKLISTDYLPERFRDFNLSYSINYRDTEVGKSYILKTNSESIVSGNISIIELISVKLVDKSRLPSGKYQLKLLRCDGASVTMTEKELGSRYSYFKEKDGLKQKYYRTLVEE